MHRTYHTEGLVIKKTKIGEADAIITLFTKDHGRIKTVAKGIRKTISKKSGNLDLLNWNRLLLSQGRNLDIILEAEAKKTFINIKKDLKKSAASFEILELLDKLLPEREPHYTIYCLALRTLSVLEKWDDEKEGNIDILLSSFGLKTLKNLGFWSEEAINDLLTVSSSDHRRLDLLLNLEMSKIEKVVADQEKQTVIKNIVNRFTHYILDGEIKSSVFLKQIRKLDNDN